MDMIFFCVRVWKTLTISRIEIINNYKKFMSLYTSKISINRR